MDVDGLVCGYCLTKCSNWWCFNFIFLLMDLLVGVILICVCMYVCECVYVHVCFSFCVCARIIKVEGK